MGAGRSRGELLLLSDFSAGAVATATAAGLPSELADLGASAKLWRSAAAAEAPNIQVEALVPDAQVVVAEEPNAAPWVSWTLRLRRFSQSSEASAPITVRLEVPDMAPIRRTIEWVAGQQVAELRATTPLPPNGLVEVTALLEPTTGATDTLATDNQRHAVVRVKAVLGVAMVGDEPEAGTFTPERWVRLALVPVGGAAAGAWPIELRRIGPELVDNEALRDVEVVLVLQPHRLDEESLQALVDWTEAGGLLWWMPPATDAPALWVDRVAQALGLSWRAAAEARSHDSPLRVAAPPGDAAELLPLRGELEELLRPVRIHRSLALDTN